MKRGRGHGCRKQGFISGKEEGEAGVRILDIEKDGKGGEDGG